MTRHDILCPNAVKRDVGKTRCKSDVIYATALCCAICTSLTLLRNLYVAKRHLLISFKAQEVQTYYDFFAKKYLTMDRKIYTYDCLNSYLITLELEEYKHVFKQQQKQKRHRLSRTLSVSAVVHSYSFSSKDLKNKRV